MSDGTDGGVNGVTLGVVTWVGRALLGSGRIDEPLRSELLALGPLVFAEELSGSYVLRTAGEYTLNPTRGAVVLCPDRFVVWSRRSKTVDVPLERRWFTQLAVEADRPDRLVVTAQLGGNPGINVGSLSVRLRTPEARRVAGHLANVR
jgi:hypothetical protein